MTLKRIGWAALALPLLVGVCQAQEFTILVAQKGTPADESARKLADDTSVFAERKLHKALDQAVELIEANPKATVNVKVASGAHEPKGGRGTWTVSQVIAPEATLRILGGYGDGFEVRKPFETPTVLANGAPSLVFDGNKHALKELYLSGFFFDAYATNIYDPKSNTLMKGRSVCTPIVQFGYLTTNRLVIADCVFVNSSQSAAAPLIRAMTKDAEVLIRNNFIVNNVMAWKVDSARFRNIPGKYVLEGNSFIMNWPYNPDPTTANPGTVQVGNKYASTEVVIEDNLFAHNMGGALHLEGDSGEPKISIQHNLFFDNATLFGLTEPGAGAVVGKFGGFLSPQIPWNVIDIEMVEDDYDWESDENVVLDPKVPVALVEPGFANSNDVSAGKTVMNDLRSLLGKNLQGGKLAVKNYAPRTVIDQANLPFPQEAKAKAFGVNPERVEQF